ncbi:MAG: secondary thiamine-phosphate synthase enzyme YjbQ [Thermodesulfobacteriota bacterium]
MHFSSEISLDTRGFSDVHDITGAVEAILKSSKINDGLLSVFVPGSTGSVTTIEYEEGVVEDLKEALERLVPSSTAYRHDARWGDGNGFSHVRAALMKPGITVPVVGGALTLGTWQQIVFMDFDNRARGRRLVVQIVGD